MYACQQEEQPKVLAPSKIKEIQEYIFVGKSGDGKCDAEI